MKGKEEKEATVQADQKDPAQSTEPIVQKDLKEARIEELTNTLQRLQAEFENFKKWTEKNNREHIKFTNAQLIGKFLPLKDTFEAALKGPAKDNPFAKGVEMLFGQLQSILKAEGLKHIECVGKKFDPNLHDVMLKEKSDKPEGTILEEFQKGYLLHDKVLRHSKVKISG